MSDNYVQSATGTGSGATNTCQTTLNGVVAGNAIVAFAYNGNSNSSSAITGVADGQGSYTAETSAIIDATNFVVGKAFVLLNANAGTHVITATMAGNTVCDIFVVEVGTTDGASAFSGANGAFQSNPGTGTDAISSGSVTVTGAATLVASGSGNAPTAGTGFTSRVNGSDAIIGDWRVETGAFSANAPGTFTSTGGASNNFITLAVAILNAPTASDGIVTTRAPTLELGTPKSRLRGYSETSQIGSLAALGLSVCLGMANLVGLSTQSSSGQTTSPELALGTPVSKLRGVLSTGMVGQLATNSVSVTTGWAELDAYSAPSGLAQESPGIGLGTPKSRLKAVQATDQIGQLGTLSISASAAPAALTGSGALAALAVSATTGQADLEPLSAQPSSGLESVASPGLKLGTPRAKLRGVLATDNQGQLSSVALSPTVGWAELDGSGALAALALSSTVGPASLSGSGALSALALSATVGPASLTGAGALATLSLSPTVGWAELDGTGALTALGLSASVGAADLEPLPSLPAGLAPYASPGLSLGTPKSKLRGVQATDSQGQLSTLSVSSTTGIASLTVHTGVNFFLMFS